ncbi:MAG: protein-glutamate O-methyltransferase CheR [Deltaproteobacteria bacterium]|nr:protein-glutamate O-methyltransferase CheR [Deltaproteobacteria bacterium]
MNTSEKKITPEAFSAIQAEIMRMTAIEIRPEKAYMIEQRLEELAVKYAGGDFLAFSDHLRKTRDQVVLDEVIGAITTNETSFFRDGHPFSCFQEKIIPRLATEARAKKAKAPQTSPAIQIWSAASSTGQEPYSIAMMIWDYLEAHRGTGVEPKDFFIRATDISSRVLEKAKGGVYQNFEMNRGLSEERKAKFFTPENGGWRLREDIRQMVQFQRVNLAELVPPSQVYDVIFCRNVLIYFNEETRMRILDRMRRALVPGGILFLGSSENTYHIDHLFRRESSGTSFVYYPV